MNREQAQDLVQGLLGDEPYERFFARTFGRTFLHLPHGGALRTGLLGEDPRATILDRFASHAPRLTCHTARPLGPAPEARAVSGPEEFAALIRSYHANGFTVRIPDMIGFTPQLARLGRALEVLLLKPVDAVIFWNGPVASAPVHHDEYEVLAIQLIGTKRWVISGDPPALTNPWKRIGEPPPPMNRPTELEMTPGDLLYLPRGTPHTVMAGDDSIHISIGFTPLTVRDAVAGLLDFAADRERSLREGALDRLDMPLAADDAGIARIRHAIALLGRYAGSPELLAEAAGYRASRAINDMPRLALGSPDPQLTAHSRVRHTPLALALVTTTPAGINFAQPAEHILVNAFAEAALRFVADTPEFFVGEIPGDFGDDTRAALAGRLVTSGFLEIV